VPHALIREQVDSRMAEALEAMVDLDLTDLAECQPPRGYGRN
jgi:hypothetical protein